jgi:hypothetical protein
MDICADVDFPPCMMIRRMLESTLMVGKQVSMARVAAVDL